MKNNKRTFMGTNIFFDPWVGKDYGKDGSLFKQKIMVLGASSYCDTCPDCGDRQKYPDCTNFITRSVVEVYLGRNKTPAAGKKGSWKKTFTSFVNSMLGKSSSKNDRERFFDSVVFYNYLQVSAGIDPYSAGNYPHGDQRHHEAFLEVLKKCSPDVVICWGDRVWENCKNKASGKNDETGVPFGGTTFKNFFRLPYDGGNALFIGVKHPCSGFGRNIHHQLFNTLIFQSDISISAD
jgi:hypothetical protein